VDVAAVFDDAVTRELLERADLARVAYTAADGSPRVVPVAYLVRDTKIILWTVPSSAKVAALRHDPRVALTIDVGGTPPCCLLVRGTAEVEIVDGVPDGYLEACRRTVDPAAWTEFEAGVRHLYDQMACITVVATWAKLLDFQRAAPEAVERLARTKSS